MIFLNKYKPQKIDEFKTNNEFKLMLKNMIHTNNLNILISGNSDSGKTTLLNILINEYYGNTKNVDENVLKINSLGENGIHFFRNEVKTFCKIPGSIYNKKKIIIIDDIDLLSEANQQIFRNFIDNYSKNVFFITSCINIHKVIETIQSRLNIIKLPSITNNNLKELCNEICKSEELVITEPAREKIILLSNKSIRTLISYLEKIFLLDKKVDEEIISNICTNINFTIFENYTNYLFKEDNIVGALEIFITLSKEGYSVLDILNNYFLFIKITTIIDETKKYKIIPFLCKTISNFYIKHDDIIELFIFTHNLYKII